ncbi:MAG TPA: NAD-dependent epimerase/dehydratase family protein [Vicinamibacterales bacterium]|nr:NAD-dependent epimerase/dehydratase family protein [Vicinamibacterales bacterium]
MTSVANRRVCVVGGLGFIGVNLTERLLNERAVVTVLTPLRERHGDQADAFERRGARIVEGDVRDRELLPAVVANQDVIFNLSGQSGAVRSMEDPWPDLDLNLRGNLVLLESVRHAAPEAKVIFTGSRLQYGKPLRLPVQEDDESGPLCLHAVHKRTVEEYLKLYEKLFGLQFAIARITNPYGPGQPKGRTSYGVINRLIHLALSGEPLTIYGAGDQQRDYVHVADVVDALMRMALSPQANGRIYNVGSGVGTRLIDAAETIVSIVGRGRVEHVAWPLLAQQIETGDFVADVSRARRELGWAPTYRLRPGLEDTIAHYRAAVS